MNHQKIKLNLLTASSQPRAIDPAAIDQLAVSIKELGLINPITVRESALLSRGVASATGGFRIVAGHHRVAAVRQLGWEEIDAIVVQSEGHLQAELIEIDENLVRSELTSAQRAHYTARRAEIREALAPYVAPEAYALDSYEADEGEGEGELGGKTFPTQLETDSRGQKKSPQQTKSFAAETAALTGETKRSINQHRARGDALGSDILRVVGTSLDKGVELDALAKLPEPERTALIERAEAGEKVSARPAAAPVPPAVRESQTTEPTPTPAQPSPLQGVALVKCLDVMLSELLKKTGYDEINELALAISQIHDLDAANAELLGQCLNEHGRIGVAAQAEE